MTWPLQHLHYMTWIDGPVTWPTETRLGRYGLFFEVLQRRLFGHTGFPAKGSSGTAAKGFRVKLIGSLAQSRARGAKDR